MSSLNHFKKWVILFLQGGGLHLININILSVLTFLISMMLMNIL